jgi:hypothetical protein
MRLHYPSDLIKLKEIYNVDEADFMISNNMLNISKFEKDGYVGFVFKTEVYEDPSVIVPIKIEIENEGLKETIEGSILMFRPQIVLLNPSGIIEIHVHNDILRIDNKITIANEGKGTALAQLIVSEESDVVLDVNEDLNQFVDKFCTIFIEKSNRLEEKYSENSKIIHDYTELLVDISTGDFVLTKDNIKRIDSVANEFQGLFRQNKPFMEDFMEAVVSAYLSSVTLITEMQSFLEYLKSIATDKIILLNAMHSLRVKHGSSRFKGELKVTDLVENYYKALPITVEISSKEEVSLPLYSFFDWRR